METIPPMGTSIKVAVLIYNGVELVDMNGPIDVFVHANSYNNNRYNVYTVSSTLDPIVSEYEAVSIIPKYDIHNCPPPDFIVIPGIIDKEVSDDMMEWLKEMGKDKKRIVMSVCIGLLILAKTGLLSGRKATTHYLALKTAQEQYPDITFIKNVRFVPDGHFVSTGGITSGIDGALHLVEIYDGLVVAQQTADVMIYNRDAPLPPYTLLPPYDSI